MKFRIFLVSFLVAGGGALCAGVQQSLRMAEEMVRSSLKVAVLFSETLTEAEGEQWARVLPKMDAAVESAEYISREEALKRAEQNPLLARSLLLLRHNPFPASVVVRLQGQAWLERSDPASQWRVRSQIQEVRWDPELRSQYRSLRQWRIWLSRVGAAGLVLLLAGGLVGGFRFLKFRRPWSELWVKGGMGLMAGGLAIGLWGLALRWVGPEAASYRPTHLSFWPLVAGILGALVMSEGEDSRHG
jgi:hypothetical protein